MEEYENLKIYYKLPSIILEIMNWLCTTRFYKNTYIKRKEGYEEVTDDWKFCDFEILVGTLEKPQVIKIGDIPRYKGDHEKSIVINFKDKDDCYLIRGYATELYASKVIQNKYEIPKYMNEQLHKFINDGV